jgi:hypothetical protein
VTHLYELLPGCFDGLSDGYSGSAVQHVAFIRREVHKSPISLDVLRFEKLVGRPRSKCSSSKEPGVDGEEVEEG